MKENEIVKQIKEYLKSVKDCFYWKEHGGYYGASGVPDIIVCYKGKFIAFEVKNEKGKLTVLQTITIRQIQKAGGIAEVVRSVEEVKEIITKLR